MLTPAPKQEDGKNVSSRKTEPTSRHKGTRPIAATPEMAFPRRKVPPIRPLKSALSAMLASSGTSSNPFAELYAAISGRAESASTDVNVYFPIAREPAGTPMKLNVRKDATVEEVIGFALWSYWEEGWLPKLDDGLGGEDDPKWATKLSAVGWIMRIAEDDGEVDDDFPRKIHFLCILLLPSHFISIVAPDRNGKIAKFNADAYAVLEANTAQSESPYAFLWLSFSLNRCYSVISSTKPSFGEQDPASTITHRYCQETGKGGPYPSITWRRVQFDVQRFECWLLATFIDVSWTIVKSWPTNIPKNQSCRYCRCSPYIHYHQSVCSFF